MECLKPITLKDGRLVPCGKCPRCRRNRQRDWTFRLKAERDLADFTLWLTLTLDDDHVTKVNDLPSVDKSQTRHFYESLRKHYDKKVQFKHYIVSEYGDHTDRPHYHCLLFGYVQRDNFLNIVKTKEDVVKYITEGSFCWPFGFAFNKSLHNGVFKYVTNYVNKPELISDVPHPVRPFTQISQGIGLGFLNFLDQKMIAEDLDFTISYDGSKKVLPRYFRDKIIPNSKRHIRRALEIGDFEEAQRIQANRDRLQKFLEEHCYPEKYAKASRKMRDFEKDHTITYATYLQGCRSHELQEYQQQLKKRKSL